jgi:peptide deformylase
MMELVTEKDPILKQALEVFDFDDPPVDPIELFNEMADFMVEKRGIGLSASQVGLPYRMFIFGHPDDRANMVGVFNPVITTTGEKMVYFDEGCLSFPDLFVKIRRPDSIRVRYTTHENVTDVIRFEGLSSRVFQHELDHLDGVTFDTQTNRIHLTQARKHRKIIQRKRKRGKIK